MRYELHGYQPDNAYDQTIVESGELTEDIKEFEIPTCGTIKIEIAPDVWLSIAISEWATCYIAGKDGKERCLD